MHRTQTARSSGGELERKGLEGTLVVAMVVAALLASGCATESRALALRERTRVMQGGNWAQRWAATQGDAEVATRLALARTFLDEKPEGATEEEVRRVAAADVRSLLMVPELDPELLGKGQQWAEREMNDPVLAGRLVCRGAELNPGDFHLALSCAARSPWPAAREWLVRAAAVPGADRCLVVAEFDRRSTTPETDMSAFSPDEVRRCRSSAPSSEVRPPQLEVPVAARAVASAEPGQEPIAGGAQLSAELTGGTQGLGVAATLGWSNSRFGFGITPAVTYANQSIIDGQTLEAWSFALLGRAQLWFAERRPGALVGFGRLDVGLGGSGSTTSQQATQTASGLAFVAGLAFGAEYLVNAHLGVSTSLGGQLSAGSATALSLGGSLGVVLHE
jgi:hypothetical protein